MRALGWRGGARAHLDQGLRPLAAFKAQGPEHTLQGSDCSGRHPRTAEYQGHPRALHAVLPLSAQAVASVCQ